MADEMRAEELQAIAARQRFRNVLALISAVVSMVVAVGVVVLAVVFVTESQGTQTTLDRQDCVAHINAKFFGHLADALSKEPASTQRQDFLDQMKSDAAALNQLDETCPK